MAGAFVVLISTSHNYTEAESDALRAQHLSPTCLLLLVLQPQPASSQAVRETAKVKEFWKVLALQASLRLQAPVKSADWKRHFKLHNWGLFNNRQYIIDYRGIIHAKTTERWQRSSNFTTSTKKQICDLFSMYLRFHFKKRTAEDWKDTTDLMLMSLTFLERVFAHCCIIRVCFSLRFSFDAAWDYRRNYTWHLKWQICNILAGGDGVGKEWGSEDEYFKKPDSIFPQEKKTLKQRGYWWNESLSVLTSTS